MAKKCSRSPRDIESILSGRVQLSVGELFELIRDVNPTGAGLSARDGAARYEEKSALQSVLIRQFAHELAVERDGANDGVVLIRRKYADDAASHSLLSTLDENAQRWGRVGDERIASVEARASAWLTEARRKVAASKAG